MSFMLMQSPDPLSLLDALPKFQDITHIFLPINNAKNVDIPEAGSHWSLLVVSASDGVAFHYDSLGGDNNREAQVAANKMSELLQKPLRFAQIRDAPQQENMNDCGVFVCMFMQTILVDKLLRAADNEKVSVSLRNEHFNAKQGRKDMLRIIEEFRKEGERRRSRSPSPFRSKSPPRIGDEQLGTYPSERKGNGV
jgi:sentrin-specific protease 8